jgi:hypothetical protein
MNINKVTISGPDDKVNHDDLMGLQNDFPFVEWGILISRKRMGTNRYPSKEWLKKVHYDLNVSYHLCGDIVREFVAGKHSVVWEAGIHWKRLQLNFSFKEDKNYLPNLLEISETARNTPYKSFILAYNNGSKKTLDTFIENHISMPDNIHFLYDSSGGRGTEIKLLKQPLINYTGYAGGISPDNVFVICDTLSNMEWQDNIWIDMETGVRTNDEFDIDKVRKVLTECAKFVNVDPVTGNPISEKAE